MRGGQLQLASGSSSSSRQRAGHRDTSEIQASGRQRSDATVTQSDEPRPRAVPGPGHSRAPIRFSRGVTLRADRSSPQPCHTALGGLDVILTCVKYSFSRPQPSTAQPLEASCGSCPANACIHLSDLCNKPDIRESYTRSRTASSSVLSTVPHRGR